MRTSIIEYSPTTTLDIRLIASRSHNHHSACVSITSTHFLHGTYNPAQTHSLLKTLSYTYLLEINEINKISENTDSFL